MFYYIILYNDKLKQLYILHNLTKFLQICANITSSFGFPIIRLHNSRTLRKTLKAKGLRN